MNRRTLVNGDQSTVFKTTIILAVVFVFSLMLGYPVAAEAGDVTLSVGDTNADTYAAEEGDAEGEKKAKKGKKGKKGKKNAKKGKKCKKGKKNKKAQETEEI